MTVSHHGQEEPSEFMKQFLATLQQESGNPVDTEAEAITLKKYQDAAKLFAQQTGEVLPEYPAGKMGDADQGVLAYVLSTDTRQDPPVVVLRFPLAVKWLGMGLEEVIALRDALTERIMSLRGIDV